MSRRKPNGEADRRNVSRRAKSKPERKEVTIMAHEEEKTKPPSDAKASKVAPARGSSTGQAGKVISAGKQQFIIAPRRVGFLGTVAVQPLAFNLVEQTLRSTPEVEVVDTIGPRGLVGTLADGLAGAPTVI